MLKITIYEEDLQNLNEVREVISKYNCKFTSPTKVIVLNPDKKLEAFLCDYMVDTKYGID